MDRPASVERAERFRAMHDRRRVLLLPNAWDAGSGRLLAELGFDAIATTSGGVAWSLGYPDGEQAPLAEILAAIGRIVRSVDRPVTADFESGFGETAETVAESVRRVIDLGVAGINLEDGIRHESLRDVDDAVRRIEAARSSSAASGVPIVINARVDVWMVGFGENEAERLDEAVRRSRAYRAAGADCVYPIGLADPATISAFCSAVDAPVNIAARSGLPNLAELARLGVARVSTATRLASIAYSAARDAAISIRDRGCFDGIDATFGYERMQQIFHLRESEKPN